MRAWRARNRCGSRRPITFTRRGWREHRTGGFWCGVPLCSSSVIVRATLDMAGIIFAVAGLGFLGLGAQSPAPE